MASPNPATKLYCSEPSVVRSRDTAQASLAQEGRSQKKKKKKRKAGPGAAGQPQAGPGATGRSWASPHLLVSQPLRASFPPEPSPRPGKGRRGHRAPGGQRPTSATGIEAVLQRLSPMQTHTHTCTHTRTREGLTCKTVAHHFHFLRSCKTLMHAYPDAQGASTHTYTHTHSRVHTHMLTCVHTHAHVCTRTHTR